MTAVIPKLESGSLVDHYRPIWAGYYSAVEKIVGDGGIIIPLLDPDHVASATTMTTRTHHTDGPAAEITGTWSEAPTAFDTPADLSDLDKYQGCIPFVDLNGTDEYLSLADNAYWSRDDSSAEGFSMGVWINRTTEDTADSLFIKWGGGQNEYKFYITTGNVVELLLADDSVNKFPKRTEDAQSIQTGRWHQVVVTYDGTGGATAISGVTIYVDGSIVASTATEDASYVAMEDLTSTLNIGIESDGSANPCAGKIAGGPLSPFFTTKELNAQEVYRLYLLGRAALGLQ